jgi:hypothetical protein
MAGSTVSALGRLCELPTVNVLVTTGALRGSSLENYIPDSQSKVVGMMTFQTADHTMGPQQCKTGSGMIKTNNLRPGLLRMAS